MFVLLLLVFWLMVAAVLLVCDCLRLLGQTPACANKQKEDIDRMSAGNELH